MIRGVRKIRCSRWELAVLRFLNRFPSKGGRWSPGTPACCALFSCSTMPQHQGFTVPSADLGLDALGIDADTARNDFALGILGGLNLHLHEAIRCDPWCDCQGQGGLLEA